MVSLLTLVATGAELPVVDPRFAQIPAPEVVPVGEEPAAPTITTPAVAPVQASDLKVAVVVAG